MICINSCHCSPLSSVQLPPRCWDRVCKRCKEIVIFVIFFSSGLKAFPINVGRSRDNETRYWWLENIKIWMCQILFQVDIFLYVLFSPPKNKQKYNFCNFNGTYNLNELKQRQQPFRTYSLLNKGNVINPLLIRPTIFIWNGSKEGFFSKTGFGNPKMLHYWKDHHPSSHKKCILCLLRFLLIYNSIFFFFFCDLLAPSEVNRKIWVSALWYLYAHYIHFKLSLRYMRQLHRLKMETKDHCPA